MVICQMRNRRLFSKFGRLASLVLVVFVTMSCCKEKAEDFPVKPCEEEATTKAACSQCCDGHYAVQGDYVDPSGKPFIAFCHCKKPPQ